MSCLWAQPQEERGDRWSFCGPQRQLLQPFRGELFVPPQGIKETILASSTAFSGSGPTILEKDLKLFCHQTKLNSISQQRIKKGHADNRCLTVSAMWQRERHNMVLILPFSSQSLGRLELLRV